MRQRTARADFGFIEPAVPDEERRFIRRHYAQIERESTRRAAAAERAALQGKRA